MAARATPNAGAARPVTMRDLEGDLSLLQRVVDFLPIEQLEKSHTVKAVSRAWRTAARRALTRGRWKPLRTLDDGLKLPVTSKLVRTIEQAPLWIATSAPPDDTARVALAEAGAEFIAADVINERIALPELLEDIAQRGLSTVMVEGGAAVASAFLAEGLVDRLQIYTSPKTIDGEGVAAPVTADTVPPGFVRRRADWFGEDRFDEFERLG